MATKLNVQFLAPLKYNDGTDVEADKLFEVREKVVGLYGAVTIHPLSTEGIWTSPKTSEVYYDICRRFEVSIPKTPNVDKDLKTLKEEFKKIFKQEEIYMTYHEVIQI